MINSHYGRLVGGMMGDVSDVSLEGVKRETEEDLKEMGQVEIVLPWEEPVRDEDVEYMVTTLESRGYGVRVVYGERISCEKHHSGGELPGGTEDGIHEPSDEGIVNHIVNGVYVQELAPQVRIRVVRPEDTVGEVCEDELLLVRAEDPIQTGEIASYLSVEGHRACRHLEDVLAYLG